MFEETIFVSQFWDWFIITGTLGGILGCIILLILLRDQPSDNPDNEVKTMGHVWDEDLAEYNNPLPRWWLYLFYISIFTACVYLVIYPGLGSYKGLIGWSAVAEYKAEMAVADEKYGPLYEQYKNEPIKTLVKNQEATQLGHSLYMTYCTNCHGSDARGTISYPDLTDKDWLYGGTPKAIKMSITNGRNGMMPSAKMNGLKTDADIDNVVQYILSLSANKHDSVAAVEGEKHFKRICFVCHGMTGTGMQPMGAPNLTDNIWLYGGSEAKIRETLTNGRKGKMPAHGKFLGEAKIHLLTAYIYSLSLED
ncbi:MAG: cytochrome-c oxidase, cbb3-type subunit III [Thiomargarita sp.]|nr:cytochrome-c oxidase, cbb3-type subunit III [Thiomargarita sp.]